MTNSSKIISEGEKHFLLILALISIPCCFLLDRTNASEIQQMDQTEHCKQLASPQDVLECALKMHPETQRAQVAVKQAEHFEWSAGQRPNPEFSLNSVFGDSLGNFIFGFELALTHTIEIGGKHGARVEKALAEKEVTGVGLLKSREEVLFETLHALYRLRQVKVELHTLTEALETFERIQNQFRSRPKRTPEQEVSLGVFDIAKGDYELRKSALENELISHTKQVELAISREFKPSSELLPKVRKNWPKLKEQIESASFKGSALGNAKASLKLAEAEVSLAKSAAWPNLKLGPSFENQTDGPISYQTYGFNLSFEIPILQINGGGRAVARTGLDLAERNLVLKERELLNERQILIQKYKSSTQALESSLSLQELERKHKNTDALFARGIIPSSLVIEAHRQIVDFTKNQNEQELTALEALWKIYVLEGKAFEEKL